MYVYQPQNFIIFSKVAKINFMDSIFLQGKYELDISRYKICIHEREQEA